MTNKIDKIVGENVRSIRVQSGMTQKALADRLGIAFQQLQKYEKAINRISASKLVEIARALRVPVSDLFEGAQGDKPVKSFIERPTTLREGLHLQHIRLMDESNRHAIEILASFCAKTEAEKAGE